MDLRIGICDDAPDWREKTRETVKHCTDQMANSVEIFLSEWKRTAVRRTSPHAYPVYGH